MRTAIEALKWDSEYESATTNLVMDLYRAITPERKTQAFRTFQERVEFLILQNTTRLRRESKQLIPEDEL